MAPFSIPARRRLCEGHSAWPTRGGVGQRLQFDICVRSRQRARAQNLRHSEPTLGCPERAVARVASFRGATLMDDASNSSPAAGYAEAHPPSDDRHATARSTLEAATAAAAAVDGIQAADRTLDPQPPAAPERAELILRGDPDTLRSLDASEHLWLGRAAVGLHRTLGAFEALRASEATTAKLTTLTASQLAAMHAALAELDADGHRSLDGSTTPTAATRVGTSTPHVSSAQRTLARVVLRKRRLNEPVGDDAGSLAPPVSDRAFALAARARALRARTQVMSDASLGLHWDG